MRRAVVVIGTDPAKSAGAMDGLRMSVGLALAEIDVEVVLQGSAEDLLIDGPTAAVSRRALEFLSALRDLGARVRSGELSLSDACRADAVIRWGD